MYVCGSLYLCVCVSLCLSVFMFVCLCACHWSRYHVISVCVSVRLSVCVSVCLCVRLFVCLSVMHKVSLNTGICVVEVDAHIQEFCMLKEESADLWNELNDIILFQ